MADLSEQLREAEAERAAAAEAFQNVPPDRGGKITDWPEFRRAEAAVNRVEELKAALRGETLPPLPPAQPRDTCVGCGASGTPVRVLGPGAKVRRCDACEAEVAAYFGEVSAARRARSGAPRSTGREPTGTAVPTDDARRSILDALGALGA
jgi:hypothetical protein